MLLMDDEAQADDDDSRNPCSYRPISNGSMSNINRGATNRNEDDKCESRQS